MKYTHPLLALLVILVLMGTPVSAADDSLKMGFGVDGMLEIEIISGWYQDAEGDGEENDVITEFDLKLKGRNLEDIPYKDLIVEFGLILPSGNTYAYSYDGEFIRLDDDDIEEETRKFLMFFWDHALESGWYIFYIEISLEDQSEYAEIIFDPPEGNDGANPPPPSLVEISQ